MMVVMALFPPWYAYTFHTGNNNFPLAGMPPTYIGHHPLFTPPMNLGAEGSYAFIDVGRLIIQWVLVGSITLALVLTLNRGRDSEQREKRG